MSDKNKRSWDLGAAAYSAKFHTDAIIDRIERDPVGAFDKTLWKMLTARLPDLAGKRICVPSSGDNHAVFAFAALGAKVTSCDISENQLANAARVAKARGWDIAFCPADTMALSGIADGAFDLVYTSNGVHVWIDRLNDMYQNIARILKPGGPYLMYEIHPFQRPFDDNGKVIKPYTETGPFEDEQEINFHWRISDIVNAIAGAGLTIREVQETMPEKDYENPFWISLEDTLRGVTATREEVDRMYDWRVSPMAALPEMLCIAADKTER